MAASKTQLKNEILNALNKMRTTQAASQDPLNQFSEDLATAISNYCKSLEVTPGKFKVITQSIGINPQTLSGPPTPVPLDPTVVTLASMNSGA